MSFLRKVKKYTKKAVRSAGRKYGVSYGRRGLRMTKSAPMKLAALSAQVASIAQRLNVEKKHITGGVQTGDVAQMFDNSTGYATHQLTPTFSQGNGESQRSGNSLKLTGYNMKIQLRGQSETYTSRRLRMHFIKTTDTTSSLNTIVNDLFDPNPLTALVDYHSQRDYADNKRVHKVIRTVNMYLPPAAILATATTVKAIKDYNISLKLQEVLRFETDASTVPNDYRMFVVIFCDTGNAGSISSTNPGCMIQWSGTGIEYQFHDKHWYVDN